jgi:hypothetical protein
VKIGDSGAWMDQQYVTERDQKPLRIAGQTTTTRSST